ncbi:helix-turn-helix domain-containing protein [Actinacidiphila sp. ITFR-21]|uniref:helix-turn-helix domain-containing protein n=1 Tax=Actinacidiphila sp. ITFR-21 TaxID=3075199 RepID=UPI00288C5713|nr:helix-turn-helix transcriptional regulator [Streptomyces sp. ITFR-21]WNI19987.1 helix-turn-helix transcriptional regulator [Streptomyces sp. ITFR-21]
MSRWGKEQDRYVVRAVDVLSGVVSGTRPEPARRVIASRAILAVEQPMHEELVLAENADAAASKAADEQWVDDVAVRRWVTETLADHAVSYNELHDVWEGDAEYVDRTDHPVWELVSLSPFSRRLRLLQDATAQTAAGLGRDIGVGAHQIGHWAAGRSRPGEGDREALAQALGVHPAWLHASRDEQADAQLYRFRSCPCAKSSSMTRLGLGPEEPGWYDSPAEQDAAVHWCDGCGQSWLKDSAQWLLPLPSGEEPSPSEGHLADGSHPADRLLHRSLDEAWPAALWPSPNPSRGTKSRARAGYRIPALLTKEPRLLSAQPKVAKPQAPEPVWHARPEERVAANADWCRTCRSLVGAPPTAAGGPWLLLHRSEPGRSLSTWTYPTEKDALHAAAHLAMTYLGLDGPVDSVAADLFADQAHAQVLARFLELRPETDQFEVAELVPMRADQF